MHPPATLFYFKPIIQVHPPTNARQERCRGRSAACSEAVLNPEQTTESQAFAHDTRGTRGRMADTTS